jgi:hypothetical protein
VGRVVGGHEVVEAIGDARARQSFRVGLAVTGAPGMVADGSTKRPGVIKGVVAFGTPHLRNLLGHRKTYLGSFESTLFHTRPIQNIYVPFDTWAVVAFGSPSRARHARPLSDRTTRAPKLTSWATVQGRRASRGS